MRGEVLYSPASLPVILPRHLVQDIDTLEDWKRAEYLYAALKAGGEAAMRVLIRADASPTIGSGHIARCLTLARVLRKQGSHVAFACRRLPGHRLDALQAEGFETFALPERYADEDPQQAIESMLPWQADIDALDVLLDGHAGFDWIIVDHYGLDHHWQTAARRWASRIAAVDDLATRRYSVDLLLNQNLSGLSENYAPLLPEGCRTLLGPRFAMLREEFMLPGHRDQTQGSPGIGEFRRFRRGDADSSRDAGAGGFSRA